MSMAFAVGDWVKVVRVIETTDVQRNSHKKLAIGLIFQIKFITNGNYSGHAGQVYDLKSAQREIYNDYYFHGDELEFVSPNNVPPVGSLVRFFGSEDVVQVKRIEQRIFVVAENDLVGQVREILSAEDAKEHMAKLAAKAKEKLAAEAKERLDGLLKKQNEMVASAIQLLEEASKMKLAEKKLADEAKDLAAKHDELFVSAQRIIKEASIVAHQIDSEKAK